MLPDYVPPITTYTPKVRLGKNVKYPLVAPTIPKGVQVTMDILPNLQKMGFVDHDLHKFLELAMDRYMTSLW